MSITAHLEQSKTIIKDDGAIWWEAGEKINVFYDGVSLGSFTSTNSEASPRATFSSDNIITGGADSYTGGEYFAIYPYDSSNWSSGGLFRVMVPGNQNTEPGAFDKKSFICAGHSDTRNIAFYNVCGGIRFCVSQSGITSITFKGNASEVIAGEAKIQFNEEGKPIINNYVNPVSEITVSCKDGGSFKVGEYYYVSLFPAILASGYSITFHKADASGTYIDNSTHSIKRSTIGNIDNADRDVVFKKSPTPTAKQRGWFELPQQSDSDNNGIDDSNPDYYYSWTMREDAPKIRNFSSCYSKSMIHPVWVAAPMHSCYKGGSGRNDSYKDDPNIHCTQSAKFTGYTRGHMVGSSDRTISKPTNKQAFYYSNIGAQLSSGFNTGGGAWNNLEELIDGQWCADTLYQVIGCIFDTWKDQYGNTVTRQSGTNNYGEAFQVPTAWYKVVLRTKKGDSGKRVDQCSADELKCAAFILAHKSNAKHKPSKSDLYTVDYVEQLTGLNFFVNVPNAPKKTVNASEWGL